MTSPRGNAPSDGLPREKTASIIFPAIGISRLPRRDFTLRGFLLRSWNSIMTFREPMSGLTHFAGIFFATAGCAALIGSAVHPVRPWHLFSYAVFGFSMMLLYVASTLFHWMPASRESIVTLRKCDHIMIFIYIAATYTPFCLVPFRGTIGWTMLACIWTIALFGSISKVLWINMPRWLCLSFYLFAGLFSLAAVRPIIDTLQPWAIFWLAAGGLSYCIGALFYAMDDPDGTPPPLFGCHEIFHLFVILGSCEHFWVVYRYVNEFA